MIDYAYTESLNKEQWAWEFLRRNPGYQRDYVTFIHRWKSLEIDHGKLPNQDKHGWQNDLRSLANEWNLEMTLLEEFPDKEGNNASQETVLIEDWMRSKWGLKSFPLEPNIHSPKIPEDLEWREQVIDMDDIRFDAQDNAPIAQMNFDLRYSLKDQLEAAHKDLMKLTSQLQRLGKVKLVASDHYEEWLGKIKLLDNPELIKQSTQEQQLAASEMLTSGYRKILLMRG